MIVNHSNRSNALFGLCFQLVALLCLNEEKHMAGVYGQMGDGSYDFTRGISSNIPFLTYDAEYTCTVENLWTIIRHPKLYPIGAGIWSKPLMVGHSGGYRVWAPYDMATPGVEKLTLEGENDLLIEEIMNKTTTDEATTPSEGRKIILAQRQMTTIRNVKVTSKTPFITSITKMSPSPDWFSGFFMFNARSREKPDFWLGQFTVTTYPWDSGSRRGESYLDEVPFEGVNTVPIQQITVDNPPATDVLLSGSMDSINPVLKWECNIVPQVIIPETDPPKTEETNGNGEYHTETEAPKPTEKPITTTATKAPEAGTEPAPEPAQEPTGQESVVVVESDEGETNPDLQDEQEEESEDKNAAEKLWDRVRGTDSSAYSSWFCGQMQYVLSLFFVLNVFLSL